MTPKKRTHNIQVSVPPCVFLQAATFWTQLVWENVCMWRRLAWENGSLVLGPVLGTGLLLRQHQVPLTLSSVVQVSTSSYESLSSFSGTVQRGAKENSSFTPLDGFRALKMMSVGLFWLKVVTKCCLILMKLLLPCFLFFKKQEAMWTGVFIHAAECINVVWKMNPSKGPNVTASSIGTRLEKLRLEVVVVAAAALPQPSFRLSE